jgi:hypothetical protein
MAAFKSVLHQEIWIDHHCTMCYYGARQCDILAKALRTQRKPVEWERNPRKNVTMADSIKCTVETRVPPAVGKREVPDETLAMFDVESGDAAMDTDHQ